MKYKTLLWLFSVLLFVTSCGEEQIAERTKSTKFEAQELHSASQSTCANMTLIKPKVDILYVVDNSSSSFNISYTVKSEIAKTISSVGSHFDYHILVAPLLANSGESLTNFQVLATNTDDFPNPVSINIVSPENLQFYGLVSGSNEEHGFKRVKNIINANRSNGVFRNGAYTLVIMISNGDDTEGISVYSQNPFNTSFNNYENDFKMYTKKWADAQGGGEEWDEALRGPLPNYLRSEQFRFLSVVPHSQCKSGYKAAVRYSEMSKRIYDYNGSGNSTYQDTYNLCSGEYVKLFSNINETIKKIVLPHKYDHWKITSAGPADIEASDITVKKVKDDGEIVTIPESNSNGFEYLGYVETPTNTRYEPTSGEPKTGHLIRLYGGARVTYPECIIAKTRTPTEWFGFVVLPRKPDLKTVKVKINGKSIEKDSVNGWGSYSNNQYVEKLNIKVPGPTNAATTPESYKSGYFIKMNGKAIYTNGDSIDVYYKGDED